MTTPQWMRMRAMVRELVAGFHAPSPGQIEPDLQERVRAHRLACERSSALVSQVATILDLARCGSLLVAGSLLDGMTITRCLLDTGHDGDHDFRDDDGNAGFPEGT